MEKELKRALILTAALVLAAVAAFLAAVASTGAFTRIGLDFTAGDAETRLYVQPGETPDMEDIAVPAGARVLYWLDGDGEECDPFVPTETENGFEAVLAPALAAEPEPWLELDEHGLAHPDAYVTGEELASGVAAMFSREVDVSALAELETVSGSELASALEGFFEPGALSELDGAEPLTRLEAASIIYPLYMNARYGGDWGFDALYRVCAPDLDPLRAGADCLAACLEMEGAVSYEEGFHFIDGRVYRADETGLFFMDAEVEGIYYGADGRQTSGSGELDALVAEALEPICSEHETRGEMLRAAYLYVRDNFEYLRRNYYAVGDEGWQTEEAVTMLSTHRGNCYNYAAAFWALARGLGYDAAAVAGTVGWDRSPHGWVIMYDGDGTRVIYDVELEMAYHYNRGRTDTNLYELYPDAAYSWHYVYGEQYE